MADKVLNTRVQQKHDIEANWLKAINFIPKVGEIIVYDPDENHTTARVKIGNGFNTVNELKFSFEHLEVFVGTKEEYSNSDIPIGTLVILLDEELEPEETIYYPSLNDALNNTNGSNNVNNSAIVVDNYSNNTKVMTLLQNVDFNETITLTDKTTLKLNGCTLNTTVSPAIISNGNDININGMKSNSKIQINAPLSQKATIVEIQSGKCNIQGGTYIANTEDAGSGSDQTKAIMVYENSSLNMNDAIIIAKDNNNGSVVGINGEQLSNINLNNCEILARSNSSLENIGINTLGDLTLTNCKVEALANYTLNAAGNNYGSNSRGIQHTGTLKAYNCFVYGTHSGITSSGPCYIDGGVYNGYGHGGVYLRNPDKTSYLQNAEFNWAPMREGTVSDVGAGTNGAGMYIGGANNITVYINNCNFNMVDANGETYKGGLLPFYGIVLRTSGREKNNNVYISNSYVLAATVTMFRGGSNHNVYSGIGNDFSKAEAIYTFEDDLFHNTEENYERIF